MASHKMTRRRFIKSGTASVAVGLGGLGGLASILESCTAPGTQTASKKAIALTFWGIPFWKGRTGTEPNGKESDYYDWQIATFHQKYPNVTITPQYIPSTIEGWAKFDTAVASGHPPDVMWGQTGADWKYVPQNAVESFDRFIDPAVKGDFLPSLARLTTYVDGKTYIRPYGLALGGGVFVNTDLVKKFNAYDLIPQTKDRQWTIDQFRQLALATTQGSGSNKVYGLAFMTDWTYQMNQFLEGFGASLYNQFQSKMIANSPEGIAGLQWMVNLEQVDHVAVPGTAGRMNSEVLQLFAQQKIAMFPSQPYYIGAFRSSPDLKPTFNWTFLAPPHGQGHIMGGEANFHGYLVSKQKDADKLQMAMNFVEHLTRPESLKIAMTAQNLIPPQQSMLSLLANDPDRYVESLIAVHAGPLGRIYGEIGPKAWTPMYDSAFSRQKSPKQALDDAVTAANQIIADNALKYHWPNS